MFYSNTFHLIFRRIAVQNISYDIETADQDTLRKTW